MRRKAEEQFVRHMKASLGEVEVREVEGQVTMIDQEIVVVVLLVLS